MKSMNQYSISLGKVFGIPISIHWTFWILVFWIVITGVSKGESSNELVWYVLFIFAVFACIGLHELGHALTAKRYGIETKKITFLPIGGLASLSKLPKEPNKELMVTIMGPMVNVFIAFALGIYLSVTGQLNYFAENADQYNSIDGSNFLMVLFFTNIALFVFNMVPAFPMDGGRILRALLSMRMGQVRATKIAVQIGQIFAILFVFLGLYTNPFLIIIAIFIIISARSELIAVQSNESLANYTALDIMMRKYTIFREDQLLEAASEEIINGQENIFLVKDNHGIVGYFTKNDIIKGLSKIGKKTSVKKIMNIDLKWVKRRTNASAIWEMMTQDKSPVILVGENAFLEGMINMENLQEWLLIHSSEKKFESKEEKVMSKEWAFNP